MLLAAVALVGGAEAWRRAHRPVFVVARTSCPVVGAGHVEVSPGVAPEMRDAVLAHERVHLAQCAAMGPVRYWAANLRAAGRLAKEAPAYCAYARARLRVDPDTEYASDRLHEDLIAAMDDADSTRVKAALRAACPEIATKPRRTRSPARMRRAP